MMRWGGAEDRLLRVEPGLGLLEWCGDYDRGLLRALAERGHAVTFYEPDAFERQRYRGLRVSFSNC